MADNMFTTKEMMERLEAAIERVRSDITDYQRTTATRAELQVLQREVERVSIEAREDKAELRSHFTATINKSEEDTRSLIENLKEDINEDSRRNLAIVVVVVAVLEFALRYWV